MKKYFCLFIILFAFVAGCSKKDPLYPEGSYLYYYFGYDSSGNVVVNGTIRIAKDLTYGDWELKAIDDQQDIGPQTGSGSLRGYFHDDTLFCIELNPDMIDCNVILRGKLADGSYIGTWGYYGIAGLMNSGTFSAFNKLFP